MLVLSRGVGEQIVIDATICVTVVAIRGNKVRLGVTAPGTVRVDRAEVHERREPPGPSSLNGSGSSAFITAENRKRNALSRDDEN